MRYLLASLLLLLCSCQKQMPVTEKMVVGILPYEGFSKEKARRIAKTIDSFYAIKTVVLPEKKLYAQAFINVKSPRYRADSIIRIQQRNLPDSLDFIIGLTTKDVSTTKRDNDGKILQPASRYSDWGIMGLGFCPGKSCVVSTFRLRHANSKKQFERLEKVAVHEFGHNLGLPHCKNKKCVMTDAVESIATIDNETLSLCKECKEKI